MTYCIAKFTTINILEYLYTRFDIFDLIEISFFFCLYHWIGLKLISLILDTESIAGINREKQSTSYFTPKTCQMLSAYNSYSEMNWELYFLITYDDRQENIGTGVPLVVNEIFFFMNIVRFYNFLLVSLQMRSSQIQIRIMSNIAPLLL